MIKRVTGTQDFLDITLLNFIIEQTKKYLKLHHFSEIIVPILEPTELFKRSLGVETDVVKKEMYLISGDENICLRPEATASTARAFVENGIQTTPWKVFTWGPMFRHERPQKGRYRQFHQVSIEVIGTNAIAQDAEVIALLDGLFSKMLAFDSYALLINFLGCHEDREAFKVELRKFLETHINEICDQCKVRKDTNIMRVFDCKNEKDKELYATQAPKIIQHLCSVCSTEWQELQELLELLSISFHVQPTLVRGLDYYQKTVFEFVSGNLGAQNAFCGGGRYHQLVKIVGAREDQPSVGAAIGVERLLLMLEAIKDRLPLPQPPAIQAIIPVEPAQKPIAMLVAQELIKHGIAAQTMIESDSLKSMMRQANRIGAQHAIIIGPEELAKKEARVKNMTTGEEQSLKQTELVQFLMK